ncbi:MAG: hypothetical protein HRU41_11950 [Saprospiraceae bacterium]|nr:hypothetical protein [Saprospiraceae bacterium]
MNSKLVLIASLLFSTLLPTSINIPEAPATQDFTFNKIQDFSKADPAEGITVIPAPLPNNTGSAATGFPIKLPPGRLGIAPVLSIQYNSDAGNSWLGMGWNLTTPSISVETRWGVPRFESEVESETYLLDGQQLSPVAHRLSKEDRSTEKRFFPRVEAEFNRIIRHGDNPQNYWWEVTDKFGNIRSYGGTSAAGPVSAASLKDDSGNVVEWMLVEERDPNDNFISYDYATVADVGVSGGRVTGREIYLDAIQYTGHGTEKGPYEIRFERDRELGESLRKDIRISANCGFKRVTADLLRRIIINFKGELIRSYELRYQEGQFFKTLLQDITEYDQLAAPFYTHTFEYFNDVSEGGSFKPYGGTQNWTVANDRVRGDIANPVPGFDGETSLLGGAKSSNFDVGSAVTVGPIGNLATKTNTAGGSFSYAESSGTGLIAFLDINGDGLPDKVFEENGALYYRANQSRRPEANTGFGQKRLIKGVKEFSRSKTKSTTIGAEAHPGPFFLGYENTTSKTNVETYFSDFNGDGLVDVAVKGRVFFNHINSDGDPEFTTSSGDTPSSIFAGGTVDQSGAGPTPEELAQLQEEFPLHDVVRMWEAPYPGTVAIDAPVNWIADGADYPVKDGVKVSIQVRGAVLWSTDIGSDDSNIYEPTGVGQINVEKGDKIYFRVQSVFDGAFDRVKWDPEIKYMDLPVEEVDPNKKPIARFKASEDFLLSSCQSIGMTLSGQVKVEGRITKPITSDNVILAIDRVDTLTGTSRLYTREIAWDEVVDEEVMIEGLAVKQDDELYFRLISDTNVDWKGITWIPRLYFTSADDGSAVFSDTGQPLFDFCPSVEYSMFNNVIARTELWVAQDSGLATISAVTEDFSPAFNVFTLSAKKVNILLGKSQYVANALVDADSLQIEVLPGDSIYLEYHVAVNVGLFSTDLPEDPEVRIRLNDQTFTQAGGIFARPPKDAQIFGPQYRGWGQFIYNGNGARGTMPIDESALKLDDALMDVDEEIDYENPEDLEGDFYDPTKSTFIPMIADPKSGAWLGYDNLTFIRASEISSSRMGEDNLLPLPTSSAGSGFSAPTLLSEVKMNSTAAGGGVGLVSGSAGVSWTSLKNKLDVMDMNGDRYPDIVTPTSIQYTLPTGGLEDQAVGHSFGSHEAKSQAEGFTLGGSFVYSRVSNSAEAKGRRSKGRKAKTRSGRQSRRSRSASKAAASSIGISGNFGNDEDETLHSWMDINGDGLTDKVFPDGTVALNLGYRFAAKENWGFDGLRAGKSIDYGGGAGVNIANGSIAAGFSLSRTENYATEDLEDVNGDGLVDYIKLGDPIRVHLNTGNGFGPGMDWPGINDISEGIATGESVNGAFTICAPIFFIRVCFNPSTSVGRGVSRQISQFEDIDGDGYPDFLRSQQDGDLTVKLSKIGKTNLLKSINRPLGAKIDLDYRLSLTDYKQARPKWTLYTVNVFDGFVGDGADYLKSRFLYEDGVFDRNEREFFGFGKVTAHQLDTENGEVIYRTTTYTFANTNYYNKGLLLKEILTDDQGRPFVETQHKYDLRDITTGNSLPPVLALSDEGNAFPALIESVTRYYEGADSTQLQRIRYYEYDLFGNITKETDLGDGAEGEELITETSYHQLEDRYIVAIPASTKIFTGEGLKRHRSTELDERGNAIEIQQYLSNGQAARFDMTYDDFGNRLMMTHPENHKGERFWYQYSYDEEVHTYLVNIKDAYGYESSNLHEYHFGQLLETQEINGHSNRYTYDERGRLLSFTGPYEMAEGKDYSIAFSYFPEAEVPYATTRHYDLESDLDIPYYHFIDGLAREVQNKKLIALHRGKGQDPNEVYVVSGEEFYDAFGRVHTRFYPITEAPGRESQVNLTVDPVAPSKIEFDILDREIKTTLPDGSIMETQYQLASDNEGRTRFRTTTVDPLGRTKDSYTDMRGNQVATTDYGPEGEIWTNFSYNALSELIGVTDDLDYECRYAYDGLGRRISSSHPSQGLTTYTYDLAGNMLTKVTSNIRALFEEAAIQYEYDKERLVSITYPENIQNNVRFYYGEPGADFNRAGRVWLQEDASGGQEFFFAPHGLVTKNIRTLIVNSAIISTFVSTYEYDSWGRIQQMVYPDGEVLDYVYNRAGQLESMKGEKLGRVYKYVDQTGYDKFGDRVYVAYGNGADNQYNFEPQRRRLASMIAKTRGGQAMMDNTYRYDPMNNLISLESKNAGQSIGGAVKHQYQYDELYRVSNATGDWQGQNQNASYNLAMSYDNLYNITQKVQSHEHSDGNFLKRQLDQVYEYEEGRAYGPSKVGESRVLYDANGNIAYLRQEESTSQFVWDEEDRLSAISEDGYISFYTYDAGGERAIKSHGGIQGVFVNGLPAGMINHHSNYSAYVSPYFVAKQNSFTKHYYMDGQRIASKIGTGKFNNNLLPSGQGIAAGNLDYQNRLLLLQQTLLNYYDSLGIPPGPPTLPGYYAQPEFTGQPLPTPGVTPNYTSVPEDWPLPIGPPDTTGPPGPPVWINGAIPDNSTIEPPFGYEGLSVYEEISQFFYHTDHLGSTAYVSDYNGEARQFSAYLPFGGLLSEEKSGEESQPYLFNGKELDRETGMYYFGARYYDEKNGLWLNIDPQAELYPGLSPYAYVANNPVIYNDPDGEKIVIRYGRKDTKKISYRYGAKYKGNDPFVKDVFASFNFLKKGGVGKLVKDLSRHKKTVNIVQTKKLDGLAFSPHKHRVYYHPRSGLKTDQGGKQSPALGLLHELGHAKGYLDNPTENDRLHGTHDHHYDNLEEKRVIKNIENPAARKLGEATRTGHGGRGFRTIGPTSTKRAAKRPKRPRRQRN